MKESSDHIVTELRVWDQTNLTTMKGATNRWGSKRTYSFAFVIQIGEFFGNPAKPVVIVVICSLDLHILHGLSTS